MGSVLADGAAQRIEVVLMNEAACTCEFKNGELRRWAGDIARIDMLRSWRMHVARVADIKGVSRKRAARQGGGYRKDRSKAADELPAYGCESVSREYHARWNVQVAVCR